MVQLIRSCAWLAWVASVRCISKDTDVTRIPMVVAPSIGWCAAEQEQSAEKPIEDQVEEG